MAVGLLELLLVLLFASCGLVGQQPLPEDQSGMPQSVIGEYGLTRPVRAQDFTADINILIPEDWIGTEFGSIFFSPDRDTFSGPNLDPREITDEQTAVGNLFFVPRSHTQAFNLPPDATLEDLAESYLGYLQMPLDLIAFTTNGKPAIAYIATPPMPPGTRGNPRPTVIHVFVEIDAGFGVFAFNVRKGPDFFEFEQLVYAIAGTLNVRPPR